MICNEGDTFETRELPFYLRRRCRRTELRCWRPRAAALLRCSRRAARRALEGLREALKRGLEGRARSYVTWGERRPCKISMSRVTL